MKRGEGGGEEKPHHRLPLLSELSKGQLCSLGRVAWQHMRKSREQQCGHSWEPLACSAVFTEGLAAALIQWGQVRGVHRTQGAAGPVV